MSTYAQVSDLITYTTLTLSTPDDQLQALLNNAERDVDRLFNPSDLTNSLQGIQMSGVDGGDWMAGLVWQGDTYTSDDIPYDASGLDVIAGLNAMTNVLGQTIMAPAFQVPQTPSSSPDWASGPLPLVPVVVEAIGYLGQQVLAPLTITSSLTGDNPTASVVQFLGGGVRFNIWQLMPLQVTALRNATCAQAEYRDQMGEDHYVRAQWDSVSGPEFRTTGKLPMIGPKVHRELQGSGLVQYSVRAALGSRGNMATVFARVGDTTIPDDWRAV